MHVRKLLLYASVLAALGFGLLAFAVPASADSANIGIDHNGGAPNINAGPATVAEGGSVTVSVVAVAPPSEIGAWTIDIEYNPAVLNATGCVAFGFGGGGACNENFAVNQVRTNGADITGVSGTVALGNITFAATGAPGTCSNLTVTVPILVDPTAPDPIPIDPVISNGRVCVQGCADTTADGRVGIIDVLRFLIRILLGRPYDPAFDLNGDGVVNGADLRIAAAQLGTRCSPTEPD